MTTLYGGTEDYGMPTTLQGWSEYQPPVTYYNPVQQNYATQTNNNTTVKNQAPMIVPNFQAPALPAAPNFQFGSIPQSGGGGQTFDSASVTPVGQLLGNLAGPEAAYAVAPGQVAPPSGGAGNTTPSVSATAPGQDLPQGDQQQAPEQSPPPGFNASGMVPQIQQMMEGGLSTPNRETRIGPEISAPLAQYGSPQDIEDAFKTTSQLMAKQMPAYQPTKLQKLGYLFSPEARKIAEHRMAVDAAAHATVAKEMLNQMMDLKKQELAKQMTVEQQLKAATDYVAADESKRRAMEMVVPGLQQYRNIPQSADAQMEMMSHRAEAVKKIIDTTTDLGKLAVQTKQLDAETTKAEADARIAKTNAAKGERTLESDVKQSTAAANKSEVEARIAAETEQDKINQSHTDAAIKQWELANKPTDYLKNNLEYYDKFNDALAALKNHEMSTAKGTAELASILGKQADEFEMAGHVQEANQLRRSAMQLFNLGEAPPEPPPGVHQNAKGQWVDAKNKPTDYKPELLGIAQLGGAATKGGIAALSGMVPPPSPMTLQGGVSASPPVPVQQFAPGQMVPPPPLTAPSIIQGLPMAGRPGYGDAFQPVGTMGGIGGGMAGHQAPGGGFAAPPEPYQVPPGLMQQYPQYGGAQPASMGVPPQQPLQGGVQMSGQNNPVAAFNKAMQPPQQVAPQAQPPQQAAPPQLGPFEQLARFMQSGKGTPPRLGPNNPPEGLQRVMLGGVAAANAYAQGVGGGLSNAINRAVAPYRMPPPEVVRQQYEAAAVRNADKMQDMVVTPWVTPESRGLKKGAMLTDPELVSYFAHKGRDSFTMAELIRRAGWTPPAPNFERIPQPLTEQGQRFKRYESWTYPVKDTGYKMFRGE